MDTSALQSCVVILLEPPHDGLQPVHQKSTCIPQFSSRTLLCRFGHAAPWNFGRTKFAHSTVRSLKASEDRPQRSTLTPKPYTLTPKPQTDLNPQPSPLSPAPQPQVINPEPLQPLACLDAKSSSLNPNSRLPAWMGLGVGRESQTLSPEP